jgi:AbrB family looped-hinge helix DNA binding protein
LEIKRKIGQKGQIVIPKIIREFLTVGPGDEVIIEVRRKEVLIRSKMDPVKFVEDFCSTGGRKLNEKINLEELLEEKVEERFALH